MNTVLIVGMGDIGEHVLELLARVPIVSRIYVTDKREDWCRYKIHSAVSGAAHQDFYPKVDYVRLDLNSSNSAAATLIEIDPDIILSAVTLKAWWASQAIFPQDISTKLREAGFGPWLPFHFDLVYKLMKAVKRAKVRSHVLNCSFPDAVNAVLGKLDMAPTVGIGNCDLFVPWLRKIVADKLDVSPKDVSIYLVGHHSLIYALSEFQNTRGCPYYLKITANDKDVTDKFSLDKLLVEATRFMPRGRDNHFVTAASAVKNIMSILDDTNALTYAPGAEGLVGGYPTRLSCKGARIYIPAGLTRQEAVKINEDSQRLDGIERIEKDGTVVFTESSTRIITELLQYECRSIRPEESEERAELLLSAYDHFAEKFR